LPRRAFSIKDEASALPHADFAIDTGNMREGTGIDVRAPITSPLAGAPRERFVLCGLRSGPQITVEDRKLPRFGVPDKSSDLLVSVIRIRSFALMASSRIEWEMFCHRGVIRLCCASAAAQILAAFSETRSRSLCEFEGDISR